MAETDPVEIVVEIINKTKDEIAKIKQDLREIGLRDVDVDLTIHSEEEIASTMAQIQALEAQSVEIGMDVDDRVGMRKLVNDLSGGTIGRLTDEWLGDVPRDLSIPGTGPPVAAAPPGFGANMPDVDLRDRPINMLSEWARKNTREFKQLGRTLMEYRPSIMDWWNVLALLIPIMISLAGAAIGLAAALGAVAAGGAAIVGVGLLGWGKDFQSSLQNIQREATRVGQALFDVFKPVGDLMQPIVERWMSGLANQARELVGPLSQLVVFADGLAAIGAGMVDWTGDVMTAMADMNEMAEQVVLRFGGAFGDFLIDALSAMLREVYRNQDAYINMAELLLDVIVIIFNLSKAVTFVVSQFEPLFAIVAALTNALSNRFVVALLTAITTVLAIEGALTLAALAFANLQGASLAAATSFATNLIPQITAAIGKLAAFIGLTNAATFSWMRLAAVTGAGLLLAGGGLIAADAAMDSMTPPATGGGTRQVGGTTVINVNGDVRKREVDRIVDEMGTQTRRENDIAQSMRGN